MASFFPELESFTHPDNGMTLQDMMAILSVARRRKEIIMFRSTGPWSRRWIERGHPTKPFHVKGKSSDWGPHAGFVPHLGVYSKVGGQEMDALDGDDANAHGIYDGFAKRVPLTLSREEFQLQMGQAEGNPSREAIQKVSLAIVPDSLQPNPEDRFVWADRIYKGDTKRFAFWARYDDPAFPKHPWHSGRYTFYVFPDFKKVVKQKDESGKFAKVIKVIRPGDCVSAEELSHHIGRVQLFEVMGTAEIDELGQTTNRPLTGDYDLFAIGPHFNDYSPSDKDKRFDVFLDNWDWKNRVAFYRDTIAKLTVNSQEFDRENYNHALRLAGLLRKWNADAKSMKEDEHKGNVTPRILEVLNALNLEMGIFRDKYPLSTGRAALESAFRDIITTKTPPVLPGPDQRKTILQKHHLFRRAHHNEEAGRPFFAEENPTVGFGDGKLNDACPITVFQPESIPGYDFSIGTLVNAKEIREYFLAAYDAGFVLPKNPNWAMGSRIQSRIDALNKPR